MILVIGAGSIGKRHLRNLLRCGIVELMVVDSRADRLQEAHEQVMAASEALEANQSRGPLTLLTAHSIEEAFGRSERYEAAIIATPPAFHPEAVRRAVEAAIPILCEKPLATDETEWTPLQQLCATAAEREVVSMVAYNYRFNTQLQTMRRMVLEGQVGRVLSVRGTFSENVREWHPWEGLNFYMSSKAQGGGALLDESHLIDLCRWLFGEITEVTGYNQTVSSLAQEPQFETDDVAEVIVRFASGAIGSLHMDLYGKYHQKRLEVIGEDGTLFWHFDNTDIESNRIELWKGRRLRINQDVTRRQPEQIIESDGMVRNAMYEQEIRYFLQAIQAGRHLRDDVPDLLDGLRTLAVVRAARRSARSRRVEVVETPSPAPASRTASAACAGEGEST